VGFDEIADTDKRVDLGKGKPLVAELEAWSENVDFTYFYLPPRTY
jgi:hypothetical protein